MTTLAIIGGGIAGRSLLYALSSHHFSFDKILFFESDSFAPPCARHSTAIVAPRGVTSGHSVLGDLILDGFREFSKHVREDHPAGVYDIQQYTGAISKLEQFKLRYPKGSVLKKIGSLELKDEIYFAEEEAFMVDPDLYLEWLLSVAQKRLPLTRIKSFVTNLEKGSSLKIKTQDEEEYSADHVIYAAGAQSHLWKNLFPDSKLKSSKPVQGSYLEFSNIKLPLSSLSVTFEGCNFIYHAHSQKLLIGSTTHEFGHSLAPTNELKEIYQKLSDTLNLNLPDFKMGKVVVGHREKAQKREPYLFTEGNISFVGGFYKNGFTLSLKMTRTLVHQFHARG